MEGLNIENVYLSINDWKLRGSRPANHPLKRLHQYDKLMKIRPYWMEKLQKMNFSNDLPETPENMASNRKILGLKTNEKELKENIFGGVWGGTRVHT